MFSRCKYIVVKNQHGQDEQIFTFTPQIDHISMRRAMSRLRYDEIVSAGFVDEFMNCYGSSSTLRVSSRPEEDTKLLHKLFEIEDKEIKFKMEDIK